MCFTSFKILSLAMLSMNCTSNSCVFLLDITAIYFQVQVYSISISNTTAQYRNVMLSTCKFSNSLSAVFCLSLLPTFPGTEKVPPKRKRKTICFYELIRFLPIHVALLSPHTGLGLVYKVGLYQVIRNLVCR